MARLYRNLTQAPCTCFSEGFWLYHMVFISRWHWRVVMELEMFKVFVMLRTFRTCPWLFEVKSWAWHFLFILDLGNGSWQNDIHSRPSTYLLYWSFWSHPMVFINRWRTTRGDCFVTCCFQGLEWTLRIRNLKCFSCKSELFCHLEIIWFGIIPQTTTPTENKVLLLTKKKNYMFNVRELLFLSSQCSSRWH